MSNLEGDELRAYLDRRLKRIDLAITLPHTALQNWHEDSIRGSYTSTYFFPDNQEHKLDLNIRRTLYMYVILNSVNNLPPEYARKRNNAYAYLQWARGYRPNLVNEAIRRTRFYDEVFEDVRWYPRPRADPYPLGGRVWE